MSYSDIKITQADINNNNVRSASDILIGNADDNKAVFDKLPEFIAGKHNELVDALDEVSQDDSEAIEKLSAEKLNSPMNGFDPTPGNQGDVLTSEGNGRTQWTDRSELVSPWLDVHGEELIGSWLDEHPEATTTVQDGAITNKKLASNVASSYYDNISYKNYRKYDTDIYYTVIPVNDEQGNKIEPFFYLDEQRSPNVIAQDLRTDITINGACNYKKTDSTWQVGNVISQGNVIWDSDITGTLVCNDAGYFSIGRDRTFKTYPITTTKQELLADDAYTVSDYYYRLVINGEPNDFTSVYHNEGAIVSGIRNPYITIGAKANKELVIMACDGRTNVQKGLTPEELASEMISLGVVNAVMLDGGGSTSMSWKSVKVNKNDDGGGTVERMIRFTLNVKKPNVNDFIGEPFAEIGQQRQAIRSEIYPYINDLYGITGNTLSNGVTAINNGTNLNDIVDVGRYRSVSGAVSSSLQNCPTSLPFTMTIDIINSGQMLYTLSDLGGNVYTRIDHYYSNAHHFTAWHKMCAISSCKSVSWSIDLVGGSGAEYVVTDTNVKSSDVVVANAYWAAIQVSVVSIHDGQITFYLYNSTSGTIRGGNINYIALPAQ